MTPEQISARAKAELAEWYGHLEKGGHLPASEDSRAVIGSILTIVYYTGMRHAREDAENAANIIPIGGGK